MMDVNTKNVLTNIEKCFNVAECIPVVSLFAGALRAIAGKIQAIAGAIMAVAGFIGSSLTNDIKWENMMNLGSEFVFQGALNIIRGVATAMLCSYTLFGNLVLLIPNMARENKEDMFGPYFSYGMLTDPYYEAYVK